jgi:hypothetical protein
MSGTAGTFTPSTGTINYNAAGAQTVNPFAYTFNKIVLSGSGAKSIAAGAVISGNLSIAPTGSATASIGAGLNISVGTLTIGGLGTINGTWGSNSSTATNKTNTYFAATTGILTVATDSRTSQATLTAIATPSTLSYGATATLSSSGGSGSGAVSFSVGASTGCSISGGTTLNVVDVAGTCAVTATKAADTNYNAASSAALTVPLSKANQTITFDSLTDKQYGSPDFNVSATSTSGLTVAFSSQTLSVCTVSVNTVHLLTTGTCTIRASQAGDSNYNAAASVDRSFNVFQSAAKFVITGATNGTIDLASFVTIEAQTVAGDLVSTYQQDVTLVVSGSATGGGLVNIVDGVGTTTISDAVIETVHLSLQDTALTNLDVSSSRDVTFGPGLTATLSLSASSSTEMVAGTLLPLTVSRQDRLGNNILLGSETFSLYSNSSSPAKKFYDAESGGNIITTVLIPNDSSSATVWYYDELVGVPTITVSDNTTSPDGTDGVDDATVNLTVVSAPALTLSLTNPGDLVAGGRLPYEVSRQDQFGNPSDNGSLTVYLYHYSSAPSTTFYDLASEGSEITSLVLNSGVATSSFWLYGDKIGSFNITVSDNGTTPDGATGVNDISDSVTINAGPAAALALNSPSDVMVGTRAAYVVSRLDSFSNLVTTGETTVYLSHNDPVGTSTEFFNAANGGSSITSLPISDTLSSANFWLYPSGVGSYGVTVSDATPADGATGLADAVDTITILATPIVATRFVILDPTSTIVGDTAVITIQAQDGAGSLDTSYNGSVTLRTTGNATPGGVVSLSGGVGTINIIDTTAESVSLSLEDTGSTGLDVSSSKSINFLPGPTSQFIMTGSASAVAGERVGYTISRKDQYANQVTSGVEDVYLYSNALPGTASFYNAASGGTQILSSSILNGLSSTNVYFSARTAGTWVTEASDNANAPDGGTGIVDGTSTIIVSPAATARLALNDPGDMFNGTRLGYTATRYDAFDNLVTAGSATYYLYSNATGTSTAFYLSSSGGSPVTSLGFTDTQSTANFWYSEVENGIWTVYVSDNSNSPDGASGIVDGEDGVIVSAIPIVATKFIIVVPDTSVMVNTPTVVTVRAVDNNNDIDTTFNGSVTLAASGLATGAGLVSIVNGIGQITINDIAEETVNLSLQDTALTGLNVSDTQIIVFSRTPAVPVGGGGGSGFIAPVVSFIGLAFPKADIEIMAIQDGQVPVGTISNSKTDGSFSANYTGKLPASIKSFALVVYDKDKNIAQTKIFKLGVNDQLLRAILMSPTIELKQDRVTLGTFEGITGSAMPGYKIDLMIDGVVAPETTTALGDGKYDLNFNTYRLGVGDHTIKVRQVSSQGAASDYSVEKTFVVTKSFIPKADLNRDGKMDIADWGIFMSRFRLLDDKDRLDLDLNGDSKVDIQDLNLMMAAVKS